MEHRGRECVHLNQTKERLEADLALCHDKLHTSHLEVHISLCLCVHVLIRVCVCVGQSYAAETFLTERLTEGTQWDKMPTHAIY